MKKILSIILISSIPICMTFALYGCGKDKACEHSYGNWTVVTAATCTQDGIKERVCSKCNNKETASIPAVGHNFVNGICTDCGATE